MDKNVQGNLLEWAVSLLILEVFLGRPYPDLYGMPLRRKIYQDLGAPLPTPVRRDRYLFIPLSGIIPNLPSPSHTPVWSILISLRRLELHPAPVLMLITLPPHITPAVHSTLEIPERACGMLDAAMIEGAWKASPRATSEDGRDCHFRKAEWFEAPSAALARLVALDRTITTTPAGLAFSPPYVAANGV